MPITESTAAIIGIAAAATTSAAEGLAAHPGVPLEAVIANESPVDFAIHGYAPVHGHTFATPSSILHGDQWVKDRFNEYADGTKTASSGSPSKKEIAEARATWLRERLFEKYAEDCVTRFGGTGDGMGFEQLIRLESFRVPKGMWHFNLYLLIRRLPGGDYGVGFHWQDRDPHKNKSSRWTDDTDEEGVDIIDLIKSAEDNGTMFTGYSDGGGAIAGHNANWINIKCSAPGEVMRIDITDRRK